MRATLVVAVALASVCVYGFEAGSCSDNDNYTSLSLNLQWPPVACGQFGCKSSLPFFTIHGLWPDGPGEDYPCYCTNQTLDLSKLSSTTLNSMVKYWPSFSSSTLNLTASPPSQDISFWEHEFTKHLTCLKDPTAGVGVDTEWAFSQTLSLRESFDAIHLLSLSGIVPGDNKSYSRNDILKALGSAGQVELGCDNNGALETLAICYENDFSRIDCPTSGTCPDSIGFPSTTPS